MLALAIGSALAATPDISSNRTHTLAIDKDGGVYAWGSDARGQLGIGRTIYVTSPTAVAGIPSMSAVTAGTHHVLALDNSGNVWSWGGNAASQLGRREQPNDALPGRVQGITGVTDISAGEEFSAALKSDGSVWVWGVVTLFGSNEAYSPVPRRIAGLSGIVKIAAGTSHLLALKGDGTVWGIGSNSFSQLGDGSNKEVLRTVPFQIPGTTSVTAIAAGYSQSLAVKSDGTVLAWGDNYPQGTARTTAQPVAGITDAIAVGANQISYAVRADGSVVRWDNSYAPVVHSTFAGVRRFAVGGPGNTTTYGLTATGTILSEGGNFVGQRGLGSTGGGTDAQAIPGIADFTHVAAGYYFAVARRSNGTVLVWGGNDQGQLANGDIVSRSVPRRVQGLPASITAVRAGWQYSLALESDGRVWAWGNISVGQPGTPVGTPRSIPAVIPGLSDVVDMAAGANEVIFLTGSGQVLTYGVAGAGALGSIGVPRTFAGLSNIVAVAAGVASNFAVGSSGALFAWGYNNAGQLGDGTISNTYRDTPALVNGISGVTAISIAQDHAIARTSDGKVWTWGKNEFGQLGDGTTTLRATPAAVAGISGAVAVTAGFYHSLALLADGSMRAWGSNAFGQLGDGTTVQRSTPVQVQVLDGVTKIASTSTSMSFAVRTGGTAWAWGGYANGEAPRSALGDGTFSQRTKPVLVLREEEGNGNLDGNEWFLDLDPPLPDNVPAGAVQKIIPVATVSGGKDSISLAASINYRLADYGKSVGTYVMGLVPPAFLGQVKLAPSMSKASMEKLAKANEPVLVQLTPAGWATVTGQLVALSAGVINANGGANSILNGVNPSTIPGARFCIGYGESSGSMLTAETLREVLTIEGATGDASGLPCVLSGVYVSGPPASLQGSPVTFTASVVGLAPTGSVQFREGTGALGSPVALVSANPAVSIASLATAALAAGTHSIGAEYSGDGQNPAATVAFPLLHTVAQATSGTSVALEVTSSSVLGDAVALIATVTGRNPSGTVQFKDGTANLGSPAPLLNAVATLSVSTLALGTHTLTAAYSGDDANTSSTSSAMGHTVYAAISTSVALTSSTGSTQFGSPVTFTASVTGNSPTGSITFRDGFTLLASVALDNGTASVTVSNLAAGRHLIVAEYSGDANNQTISSAVLDHLVSAAGNSFDANVRSVVSGYYQTILGRATDQAGLDFWAGEATRVNGLGADVREVFFAMAMAFFSSSEYLAKNTTDAQFITDLYQTFFDRTPDSSGLAYWQGELTASGSRSALLNSFLFSAEFSGQMTTRFGAGSVRPEVTLAIDLFRGVFGRLPDSAGFNYWLGQIRLAQCNGAAAVSAKVNEVAGLFFNSGEYLARSRSNRDFTGDVYNAYLRRGPGGDAGGFNYWVGQVATLGRDGVRAAFVPSAEFQNRVTAVVNAGCLP